MLTPETDAELRALMDHHRAEIAVDAGRPGWVAILEAGSVVLESHYVTTPPFWSVEQRLSASYAARHALVLRWLKLRDPALAERVMARN